MARLYVVPTPIGNLEDITVRALDVLRRVELVLAEDTRRTRRLFHRYEIETPLRSYHQHNKITRLDEILAELGNTTWLLFPTPACHRLPTLDSS